MSPLAGAQPAELTVSTPDWKAWVTARGSWAPDLSPDANRVVFISDGNGLPRAWVAPIDGGVPRQLPTGRDHAEAVAWSPDGEWIAVLGALGGETTRTRVWVVRPDGRDARRVAGMRSGTAAFGPWLRTGAVLALSTSGRRPEETSSTLLDVHRRSMPPPSPGWQRSRPRSTGIRTLTLSCSRTCHHCGVFPGSASRCS